MCDAEHILSVQKWIFSVYIKIYAKYMIEYLWLKTGPQDGTQKQSCPRA
jgi:hypothetical protein